MPLELAIEPEQITSEDLVQIFTLFCKAFEIQPNERHLIWMEKKGVDSLRGPFGIHYRPYMGAKFFGQRIGNTTQFHGYQSPDDLEWEKRDDKFQELVLDYFSKKQTIR